MEFIKALEAAGFPVAFGTYRADPSFPYIIYMGAGQEHFLADNGIYSKNDLYRLEYYFIDKDIEKEQTAEEALENAGYIYTKSEDVYISDEDIYCVYYDIWRI